MVEYGIQWECPKCKKIQNKLCRFKADEMVTDTKIVEKARKTTLNCLYCNLSISWKNCSNKRFVNLNEAKQSGKKNIKELR
jgi:hypothetical protein